MGQSERMQWRRRVFQDVVIARRLFVEIQEVEALESWGSARNSDLKGEHAYNSWGAYLSSVHGTGRQMNGRQKSRGTEQTRRLVEDA